MTPTLPIIHLNGTVVDTLLEDNLNIQGRIADALRAIHTAEFNRRDYYPVAGAWEKALCERQAQVQKLQEAGAYFLAIAEHCSHEQAKREARRSP